MTYQRDSVRAMISVALAALVLAAAMLFLRTPPLHVDVHRGVADIHMEFLGEYPSDIRSVEIFGNERSNPIWKIVAQGPLFQIHSFSVRVGDNPGNILPDSGATEQKLPAVGSTYRLEAGHGYRVTVCPASTLGFCRSTGFEIPPA